jgi:hypothetical protein
MLKKVLFFFTLFSFVSKSFGSLPLSKIQETDIKLISWKSEACDNTYDPNRLKDRITFFERKGDTTIISVNFSENCCAQFNPKIKLIDNKIFLLPYEEYIGEYCGCNCCYTISFEIVGIHNNQFEYYFRNKKIEVSTDHYETIEPSFTMYNETKVNRRNKFGFSEGKWINFYENGSIKEMKQYEENCIYYECQPLWTKEFYESTQLRSFIRKDTTESWFPDGELKSQLIQYKIGDTTFEKAINRFDNKQLESKYLQRGYRMKIKSEYDPSFEGDGYRNEAVYYEEYYENGQRKFLKGKDTSYTWHENGNINFKAYDGGEMEYNISGVLIKQSYKHKVPGIKGWGDFDNALYVDYYTNGNIKEITFSRDEIAEDKSGIIDGVNYYWEWDEFGKPITSPNKWKEKLPWQAIKEINNTLSKMAK